jgi:thiol-disulfide isomerase/thioredoxin
VRGKWLSSAPLGGSTSFGFTPQAERHSTAINIQIIFFIPVFQLLDVSFNLYSGSGQKKTPARPPEHIFMKLMKPALLILLSAVLTYGVAVQFMAMMRMAEAEKGYQIHEKTENLIRQAQAPFKSIASLRKPIPDWAQIIFHDIEGKTVRLSDYHGKYILLNIWATWCTPCVKELPALQELKGTLASEGWVVLAVAQDYIAPPEKIADFTARLKVQDVAGYYAADGSQIEKILVTDGVLPVTVIVTPEGYIIAKIKGEAQWNSAEVITFLKQIEALEFPL